MNIFDIILTILGLALFETASSVDNAIINAEVLSRMGKAARRWFLVWGLLLSVFLVRGVLPWLIVWITIPNFGPIGALTATVGNDPRIKDAVASAASVLLIGGGTFLLFLFFNWLFLEEKNYGLIGERFFRSQGAWFFAVVSVVLSALIWFALQREPMMAFGAVLGSTAFFIVHGFSENAAKQEKELLRENGRLSDTSKIFYLMVIDIIFSMDSVLGAFAFTLSVLLILIGNGLGAFVVRQLTVSNIERIRRYLYLKNGAMYSIGILGIVMVMESFGVIIPSWVSPVVTFVIVLYFFFKSKGALT